MVHRLAAVLAADMVGYSRLMEIDELGTLWRLRTHRIELIDPAIAKNHGNISNLKITNRAPQFFEMMIDVEVRDVRHLTDIIAALRATPAVNSADRARG